jgi:hypothetical protein
MNRKASKNLQHSRPRAAIDHAGLERRIRAEIDAEPDRFIDRIERFKRMLGGSSAATFYVIDHAHHDRAADVAVRRHIAELMDQGREAEMTTQLRAYAVKYLVNPVEFLRRRDG